MGSMVAANGDQGTLVALDPSHDGALAVVRDVPMAYHARLGARNRVDKETVVQWVRQGQPVVDSKGDTRGTQVQVSGRAVGVEVEVKQM